MTINQATQSTELIEVALSCTDTQDVDITPATFVALPVNFATAALEWHQFGFDVIPLIPHTKRPALPWEPWFDELSPLTITKYWEAHPEHEVAFKLGDALLVLDTDSLEATDALSKLDRKYCSPSLLVVNTAKGEHHYFRLAQGVFARSDSHCTETHPERIDVKTGRALITLPPSTGKLVQDCYVESANGLTEVSQEFVDAIFQHNGRIPPRPIEDVLAEPDENFILDEKVLPKLAAMLIHIDPDGGYEDWLHVLMAIHRETGGSEAGFELADAWCSRGKKYCGTAEIRVKWRSFQPDRNSTFNLGTLINMVKALGIDWQAACAEAVDPFETCDTEIQHHGQLTDTTVTVQAEANQTPTMENIATCNRLDRYSLRGRSEELEKCSVDEVLLLGHVALMGQVTVFFAAPNTGKTMITLSMIIDSVKAKRVDPSKILALCEIEWVMR